MVDLLNIILMTADSIYHFGVAMAIKVDVAQLLMAMALAGSNLFSYSTLQVCLIALTSARNIRKQKTLKDYNSLSIFQLKFNIGLLVKLDRPVMMFALLLGVVATQVK